MTRRIALTLAVAFACLAVPASAAPSAAVTAALADANRPDADKARDAARKPAELLALANVKPGAKVGDFIMGGGYLTRILAGAVGPTGKVYAYQPAEFIAFRAAYGEEQKAASAPYKNVVPLNQSLTAVGFPEPLDAIITVQNYHDMHLKAFPAGAADAINKKLFDALKPGGTFLVVDHSAADGSGFRDSDTLHRADKAAVRAEIEKAGFRFEREADLYRAPADDRTVNVFRPEIRGKTDQFTLVFRKPS
ncbi:class I SAM-dependent methyltransferase [Sphingoaurantiacus capsulatus]|uniref:Class I SAM-dependent methyltransferase n=1 Tax=Sphingoaurantiacus capsulatus TaxID=1771310 RepID=A0ABV7X5S8_9SPHN